MNLTSRLVWGYQPNERHPMTAQIINPHTGEPSDRELWSETPQDGDRRSHRIIATETPAQVRAYKKRTDQPGTLWERLVDASKETVPGVYYAKIKRDGKFGMWSAARFNSDVSALLQETRDEPWPVIIGHSVKGIIYANAAALLIGACPDVPITDEVIRAAKFARRSAQHAYGEALGMD